MISFEEWIDNFQYYCEDLGYFGPIDEYSFYDDFKEGKDFKEVAKEFVKKIKD
jgi:hypothetical protein